MRSALFWLVVVVLMPMPNCFPLSRNSQPHSNKRCQGSFALLWPFWRKLGHQWKSRGAVFGTPPGHLVMSQISAQLSFCIHCPLTPTVCKKRKREKREMGVAPFHFKVNQMLSRLLSSQIGKNASFCSTNHCTAHIFDAAYQFRNDRVHFRLAKFFFRPITAQLEAYFAYQTLGFSLNLLPFGRLRSDFNEIRDLSFFWRGGLNRAVGF